jgi:hypothetical protein
MFINHWLSAFFFLVPVFAFLSQSDKFHHLQYSREAHRLRTRWETDQPHPSYSRTPTPRTQIPGARALQRRQQPKVETDFSGIPVSAARAASLQPGTAGRPSSRPSSRAGSRNGGNGVHKVKRPGSPSGSRRGSYSPQRASSSQQRTFSSLSPNGSPPSPPEHNGASSSRSPNGSPPSPFEHNSAAPKPEGILKSSMRREGSVPKLSRKVSYGHLPTLADAEGPPNFQHFQRTRTAEGDLSRMDRTLEESANPDVRIGGEALAAGAATAAVMDRVLNGARNSGEGRNVVQGLTGEAERLGEHLHIGGHHHESSGNGHTAPVTQHNAPAGEPVPRNGHAAGDDDGGDSSDHESDEHKSDWEAHQDQLAAIGQFRGQGIRPRPGKTGPVGSPGGPDPPDRPGPGGGKIHPPQSLNGRPTRQGIPARPRKPPKKPRPPKKASSTKPWNSFNIGLTAVGVMIAGGASVAGTIAQEKGAEAAVKGANAAQLSAQAGMKGANAAQLSAEAGIESAHASTIIAEANIKISNGSKEGADGTQLIAATNYETAVHQGVNATAALQMANQADRNNAKRKRSYPPVILYSYY